MDSAVETQSCRPQEGEGKFNQLREGSMGRIQVQELGLEDPRGWSEETE